MSLKHALLGFLDYAPMTGYDLNGFMELSIQHFWHANLSQIYPTLTEMEREGLLTSAVQVQTDRPNRKVYHITDQGRDELFKWLQKPIGLPHYRVPFMVQVFFGAKRQRDEMVSYLRDQLALHQERLAAYQGPVRQGLNQIAETKRLPKEAVFWELTLEAGAKIEQAWIAWCEEAIDRIEKS